MKQISTVFSKYCLCLLLLLTASLPGFGAISPTAPTLVDGVYQIGTADELWWFAQNAAANANAVLTANIDLGGSDNGCFPGIGSSTKKFTGTFDGNGKTISGFYRASNTNAIGTGFFNYTNTGAVIKNFTLEGEMVLNTPTGIYGVGTVAGYPTGTTFEDVTSSVKLTLINVPSGARIFGGLFGRIMSSTVNRCRYNGTVDASASTAFVDRLGGIAGDGNSTFNNCLFDGEIIVGATSGLKVAGILVAPNNPATINNSLFAGKIIFPAGAAISTNCGPIAGNAGTNITVNKSYYWEEGITKGGVKTSGYLTTRGTAISTSSPGWTTITNDLNNGENNWKIKADKDYPVPSKGHQHNYVNGICINTADCEQQLQPCTQATDGYYEIGNAGQLFWFGQKINDGSIGANSNARLTASITDDDIPGMMFSGIGSSKEHAYAGIFDGSGYAIKGHYTMPLGYTGSSGLFPYLAGTSTSTATIKNLTLEGTFDIQGACQGIGAIVGYMGDYTLLENILSNVQLTISNAEAKYIGGIVGIMEESSAEQTKLSLCRSKSTLNVGDAYDAIGGLVGDMRGGTIANSLFDGTIQTTNTTADLVVGGLAGQNYKAAGSNKTSNIYKSLSHGVIKATGATSQYLGSVMGRTNQVVTSTQSGATYFVNKGATGAFGETDNNKSYATFTDASTMTSDALRTALGETNWAADTNYPYPAAGGTHTHSLNADGFCVANDGYYQEATKDGDYYQIDNAGKLYWFATAINAGKINANSKAKLLNNIYAEGDVSLASGQLTAKWGFFPMIGCEGHKFTGEFDGQGYSILNLSLYTQTTGATKKGLFIAANGASIHDFKVTGVFFVANDPGNTHGGITGETNGANYEDIDCALNIQCLTETSTTAEIGGFAGLANGGSNINRCRFSGSMTVSSGVATGDAAKTGDTHDAIGGMFGKTNNATITNCLFDGKITVASTNTDLNVGGLIGYAESATTLKNSFSHGAIMLTPGTYTKCGAVVGRGSLAASDKLYYTGTLPASGSIDEADFNNVTGNNTNYSATGLVYSLGDANWWLEAVTEGYYPVPKEGIHTHYYENGICIMGDSYEQPEQVDDVYNVINSGNLFWLAQQMNSQAIGTNVSISLSCNVDMESKEFTGFSTYTGIFDGQGYSITGYKRTSKATLTAGFGFFNTTGSATIKNLKIGGQMAITGAENKSAFLGGLVGIATSTTFEDVTSAINVTTDNNVSGTSGIGIRIVGGMVGAMNGGSMNRCRYNGAMDLDASTDVVGDRFGGLIGMMQTTASTVDNCLFDGRITTQKNSIIIGGLVGQGLAGSTIQNSFATGRLDFTSVNANCGMLIGSATPNSFTNNHYTKTGFIVNYQPVKDGYNTSGTLNDGTNWIALQNILNGGATVTDCNWKIVVEDYPLPMKWKSTGEHTHTYDNGFCTGGDNELEPAAKASDGWYEVGNAGQLWWLVTHVNDGTLARNIRIRLTADINMGGETHGSWPGFCTQVNNDWTTAYQGIFDGQGHTISNYYYNNTSTGLYRRGFFNTVYNATIRKVNFEGTMIANSGTTIQGVVVGSASGTSSLEDITSSVNISTTTNVNCVGGVVGALENNNNSAATEMNRCRYKGTITIAGTNVRSVGGVVGELRSAIVKNTMFDGTITTVGGAAYNGVGGVVGKVTNSDNSEMHRIFCHGVLSLDGYVPATNNCGIVVGAAEKTLYFDKVYYITDNCTAGLEGIGPHIVNKDVKNEDTGVTENIPVDQLLGEAHDMTSLKSYLSDAGFRTMMGEPNWHEIDEDNGITYIFPYKDESHIHKYSNGFCTSGDGEYEKPNSMGKVYQIQNGGQLFWFATQFNEGNIPLDAEVQILKDINMEDKTYIYPGIGSQKYPFKGKFNGMSHVISGYYRDIMNAEHTGLINHAEDATIEFLTLYGIVHFNLASIKSFHGSVVGYAIGKNTLITDVFSYVDLSSQNANTRVLGGIAGRTSGVLRRSRYSGTIAKITTTLGNDNKQVTTIEPMASGRQIGGIIANAREQISIEDCLFDGKIMSTCVEADTMRVSGILASNEKNSGVKITIKNCLYNGCLQLEHNYTGANKSTENGIIAGYWDSNLPKVVNNVYYLNTCEQNGTVSVGNFEGKNQQGSNTIVVTEITPDAKSDESKTYNDVVSDEKWNQIFKALDEAHEVKDANGNTIKDYTGQNDSIVGNGNWIFNATSSSTSEGIPVPGGHTCHHINDDGTTAYDQFGYCTICGKARPLEQDGDGRYQMNYVSDLASFRDMVNDGDISEGTVLNAKLTQDIDFSEFGGDFGEPIGNSNFNRYLYNFDGQGHRLLNVHITTSDQYVGFFGFAGDATHDCYIHDLTITGEIDVPYDSKLNNDKPLYMGVVGKMYRGKIENVHSQLTMKNSNATRAAIGGIVGCAESSDGYGVVIDKCSFSGTCEANIAGNLGGILGETSKNTLVRDCVFAGTMNHTYKGENNTTQFGGIVGYNADETFQGVKNCIVAGVIHSDGGRTYVSQDQEGNHRNIITGRDIRITAGDTDYNKRYDNNYTFSEYSLFIADIAVKPNTLPATDFVSGKLCAMLNAQDDDKNSVQNGHPWSQILGYQLGNVSRGQFQGAHTAGSPAQSVPMPGYNNPDKTVYKVVKDDSNNYTVDWYYMDDDGDTTPMPSDAASLKANRITYTRDGSYMKGYISVCMPFSISKEMLPTESTKCYSYKEVDGDKVKFNEITAFPIPAGTPFIMYDTSHEPWVFDIKTETSVSRTPSNPEDGAVGIYGSFNTVLTGEWATENQLYKLNGDGNSFVRTTSTSVCYPYRVYLKLPSQQQARTYVPLFVDGDSGTATEIQNPELEFTDADGTVRVFNLQGQRVYGTSNGIVVINGKKVLK